VQRDRTHDQLLLRFHHGADEYAPVRDARVTSLGQDGNVIVWRYPAEALPDDVDFSVVIEAEEPGLWVLVARDPEEIPRAVGVIAGDDRTDAQALLALWGLDSRED
jgi:hypothetical protein